MSKRDWIIQKFAAGRWINTFSTPDGVRAERRFLERCEKYPNESTRIVEIRTTVMGQSLAEQDLPEAQEEF
jgi:hypothetical protein